MSSARGWFWYGTLVLFLAGLSSHAPLRARDAKAPSGQNTTRTDRYGDPLPPGALLRLGTTRFRENEALYALAISPDGKVLAGGGLGKTLNLWDASTGKLLWRSPAQHDSVFRVAFAPDGKTLAVATKREVRLWNLAAGKLEPGLRLRGHHGDVYGLTFAPDGKVLASGAEDRKVRLWDPATGRKLQELTGHTGDVYALAFSPDGKRLASGGSDQLLLLWDLEAGKEIKRLNQAGVVFSLAFSPDGKTLAVGLSTGAIRLLRAGDAKEVRTLAAEGRVFAVTFSPDGKLLASGDGGDQVRLWEVATGRQRFGYPGNGGFAFTAVLTRDGKTLACSGFGGAVRLFDVATGRERSPAEGHTGKVTAVAFTRDGKFVLTGGGDRAIRVWERATGREVRCLRGHQEEVQSLAPAPDGKGLVSFDGQTIRAWDLVQGKKKDDLLTLPRNARAALSPDGRLIAAFEEDKVLRLRDRATNQVLLDFGGLVGPALTLKFSPDGALLLALDGNQMHLWETGSGHKLLMARLPGRSNPLAALTPDGKIVAVVINPGVDSHSVQLREVITGRVIADFRVPGAEITALALRGRLLALGCKDGTVRLWDLLDIKERAVFAGHRGDVAGLAFAPDGTVLASGSNDTTVLLWDLRPVAGREGAGGKLTAAELKRLWEDLAAEDPGVAFRAAARLAAAPGSALPFLQGRLKPVPRETGRLQRLLAELDAPRYRARATAYGELRRLGSAAEGALRTGLAENRSPEARWRIRALLRLLDEGVPLSAEARRQLRAQQLLEFIGTAEARGLLGRLARGEPGARATRDARAAWLRLQGAVTSIRREGTP